MRERALADWCQLAWELLEAGVADGRHPCRTGVLASVGRHGGAEVRWVVLRRADRDPGEVEVHTDAASAKVAELTQEPRASLAVWSPDAAVQLRLTLEVTMLTGNAAQSRWEKIPPPARLAYGGTPPPGTPVTSPADHRPEAQQERFCALIGTITAIDLLHLGEDRHRHALFERADGFLGKWRAP